MIDIRYDYCIGTANPRLKITINTMLSEAGYYSSGAANSTPVLLRMLRSVQPWLVIVDTALPPGNIEELAEIIENDGLAASIYINTTGLGLNQHVQLNWPTETPVLVAVANAVCSEFARKRRLQKEIESLKTKLDQRKIVEKAKGILVKHYLLSEDEAYRFLRQNSMKQQITISEMARLVVKDPEHFSSLLQHR